MITPTNELNKNITAALSLRDPVWTGYDQVSGLLEHFLIFVLEKSAKCTQINSLWIS